MKLRLPAILKLAIIAVCMMPAAMADTVKLDVGRATQDNSFDKNLHIYKKNLTVGEGEKVGYFTNANDASTLVQSFGNATEDGKSISTEQISKSLMLGYSASLGGKTIYYAKNLEISNDGQVYLGGKNGANQFAGLVAGNVTLAETATGSTAAGEANLWLDAITAKKLTIKGGTAFIRTSYDSGNSTKGNYDTVFGAVIDSVKSATLTEGLEIRGGYLKMGRQGNLNLSNNPNGNPQEYGNRNQTDAHFVNVISGTFKQTGGEAELLGKTYLNVNKIEQEGGTMKLAYDPTVGYDYLRLGQSATTISQSGGTMDIEGKIIYGDNGNGNMKLTIDQSSGKLSLQNGVMFTTENSDANNASVIKQTGAGSIELNGDYSSAIFNLEQSGANANLTLKNGAVMNANNVEQTANATNATLTVESGAELTAASITIRGSLVNKGTINGDVTIEGSVARTFSVRSTNGDILSNTLENSGTINGEVILDGGTLVVADDDSVIKGIKTTENGGKIEVNGSVTMSGDMELSDAVELIFSGEDSAINMAENTELKLNGAKIAVTLTDADLENLSGVKLFTRADEEDANWGSYEVAVLDRTGKDTGKKAVLNYTANGDVTLEAVPEPTTATLSLLALAALASRRRRK